MTRNGLIHFFRDGEKEYAVDVNGYLYSEHEDILGNRYWSQWNLPYQEEEGVCRSMRLEFARLAALHGTEFGYVRSTEDLSGKNKAMFISMFGLDRFKSLVDGTLAGQPLRPAEYEPSRESDSSRRGFWSKLSRSLGFSG